jgi:Rrf2 family protein
MRISAKARYGLAAAICLAQQYNNGEFITVKSLSEKLKISKLYLEQVFTLLRKSNIVISTKGKLGGYQLAKSPSKITAFDILHSIETTLFDKTPDTVSKADRSIDLAMQVLVFEKIDIVLMKYLAEITLDNLVTETEKQSAQDGYMFYL